MNMNIQTISSIWDENNAKTINENFEEIGDREGKLVSDILSSNEEASKPQINGVDRSLATTFSYLNNAGTNFTASMDGVIHRTWIYAGGTAELGLGLALHPVPYQQAGEEVCYKTFPLRHGWNHVELNFPVEKGKRYTLFKRAVTKDITTLSVLLRGWNAHPDIMNNGLKFHCGAWLAGGDTFANYNAFFEIEFITNLAQLFRLRDEKVYIGDAPPLEAKYWFKPLGG